MSAAVPRLLGDYASMLREEPKARAYLLASLVDDVGVAVAVWASTLMMTDLAGSQRARASLALPLLACFLAGAVLSGPLADWASQGSAAQLARYRWRLVLAGRAVETGFFLFLVFLLSRGAATIPRVLPYFMVSAFMKTLLRPARIAFRLDLLGREQFVHSASGERLYDEKGEPLRFKTHLVSFTSAVSFLSALAGLGGLLVGRRLMDAAGGRSWVLFLVDVLTNAGFIAVLAWRCHPTKAPREVRLADLWTREPRALEPSEGALPAGTRGVAHFFKSALEGFRFLAAKPQRPLLALLAGAWLVEVVSEMYDGPMILRHVLHAGTEGVRSATLAWKLVGTLGTLALPFVVRRVSALGKLFLLTMTLDGLVISLAGRAALPQVAAVAGPFVAVLAVDHLLTMASGALTDVAQNSVSSAAMRGRIAGTYALLVILGDIGAEVVATAAAEAWGIPRMLVRVGLLQVLIVLAIGAAGGRRLWDFGLRSDEEAPPQAP